MSYTKHEKKLREIAEIVRQHYIDESDSFHGILNSSESHKDKVEAENNLEALEKECNEYLKVLEDGINDIRLFQDICSEDPTGYIKSKIKRLHLL